MKKRDFKIVGCTAIVLGVLFVALGIFASSYISGYYANSFCLCMIPIYPYAQYSGSLIATGIVLIILGSLSIGRAYFMPTTIQD